MTARQAGNVSTLDAWGRLWGEGATDSFGAGAGSSPTHSPLASLWLAEFEQLGPTSRVLDIATGAGILPRLLQHACADESVRCDAVDAAALPLAQRQSGKLAGRAQVHFHERVLAEQLPFPDACFDMITSQFGIEYADLDRALAEACRVLKPGGHMCLVMHHAEGRPAMLAREELQLATWLLQSSGWPAASRQMLLPLSLVGSPEHQWRLQTDPELQAIRRHYDQCVAEVQRRAEASPAPDLLNDALHWAALVFQVAAQHGQAQADAAWQRMVSLLSDGQVRVQDLLDHVLPESRVSSLKVSLAAAGYAVCVAEATEQGHRMGWRLDITKPATWA